jgi:glyoxalase/bleomycin resistance protein/dioxygenase superfamily protein
MRDFVAEISGQMPWIDEQGFAAFELPNGDRLEVFGPEGDDPPFETAPVAGFLVSDVTEARTELERRGIEFIGPVHTADDGHSWSHFRAPDGHVYELTSRPDHPNHATD